MRCIERNGALRRFLRGIVVGAATLAAVACSNRSADRAPGEAGDVGRAPRSPTPDATATPGPAATPGATASMGTAAALGATAGAGRALPTPRNSRNWTEVRQQAAERLVAANPGITYTGRVPDPLLAIPVLEIELNGDGSIRRIEILREPREAKDTLKIAVDAVRRAAPFGDVSRLPRPWKFVETFLFDDARKFKPRTLDR